jgi:hypothetical protein
MLKKTRTATNKGQITLAITYASERLAIKSP